MRKTLWTVLATALLFSPLSLARSAYDPPAAAPAAGKARFLGAHPLSGRPGAGYCYIDVPHVHDFVPDRPGLYQQAGDGYVFSGDPVPFGYEGPKTVFYGHHPIPLTVDLPGAAPSPFCFMKGPHYHDYPPPSGPGFKVQNEAVLYVGPIPPQVAAQRPQQEKSLEVEYRPYIAQRPQVVVTPPPEWAGVVWVAPPPSTVVVAPQPTVVVAPVSPTVVVAPRPAVIIAPPQPTVIIGAPGVIMMGGHGKGKGWGGRGKGHFKHW